MPSTMSTSVSSDLFSSTVMTPSLPTLCIACAIILPMAASPLAEMVPICATSAEEATGLARFSMSLTTAVTAMSMPRFRSIGFMPAETDFAPSRTMACASTVAVVVPSPAVSLVLEATSRSICAPIFSNLSSSSISLATVTPSLVMRGAPKLFSMTTLRPLGPSVTFTASARISTPRSILSRASEEKRTSLAAIAVAPDELGIAGEGGALRGDHAHDVGFLHDQKVLAVDAHLGARPLAEQDPVAGLHVEGNDLAGFIASAGADGDDLALLRLLFRGIRDDDAALGLFLSLDAADDDPVMPGTEVHAVLSEDLVGRLIARPLAC